MKVLLIRMSSKMKTIKMSDSKMLSLRKMSDSKMLSLMDLALYKCHHCVDIETGFGILIRSDQREHQ